MENFKPLSQLLLAEQAQGQKWAGSGGGGQAKLPILENGWVIYYATVADTKRGKSRWSKIASHHFWVSKNLQEK